MKQGQAQFDQIAREAAEAGREGFEAYIKSGTVFAKGFEDMFRTGVSLAQDAAQKQAQYLKEAMSSKNLNEWTDAQNKIAQASFNDFMSGATKLSEMGIKLLTEASEPLNQQMGKGIKRASESMAA